MEKKKIGRPTTNARDKSLHFRLSQNEIDDIQKCADAIGENRVDAIIRGIELLKKELKL